MWPSQARGPATQARPSGKARPAAGQARPSGQAPQPARRRRARGPAHEGASAAAPYKRPAVRVLTLTARPTPSGRRSTAAPLPHCRRRDTSSASPCASSSPFCSSHGGLGLCPISGHGGRPAVGSARPRRAPAMKADAASRERRDPPTGPTVVYQGWRVASPFIEEETNPAPSLSAGGRASQPWAEVAATTSVYERPRVGGGAIGESAVGRVGGGGGVMSKS